MIGRLDDLKALVGLLRRHPVVGSLGARQVGKTTLARELARRAGKPVAYFDLEDPRDEARLGDPMLALEPLKGLVVIDEVQRCPGLFPVLRVLSDRPRRPATFLLLGSASGNLLRQGSESLAGRVFFSELFGFSVADVGVGQWRRLWRRGGFPRSYLAPSDRASAEWREAFVRTFLERDLPQLGVTVPAATMRRFWTMLAHYHGQVLNLSEFGRSLGVADTTVRRYLEILQSAMVVRVLQPWFENLSKRQVKAPKAFLADTGLLHTLLALTTQGELERHPKVGASWEGFVIEQVVRRLRARPAECHFWATHAGAELDLLVIRGGRRLGFEAKMTSAPRLTASMRTAVADLGLQKLYVIYPGAVSFSLSENVRAVGLERLLKDLPVLR